MHGDDFAGEKALIELIAFAVEAHDVVAADPPRFLDRHRVGESFRREGLARFPLGKTRGGGAAEQPAVRRILIVLGEKSVEPFLQGCETRQGPEVVGATHAHRAPEALHFAARLRVIRAGMKQLDPHASADDLERLASIRRAVIQIECPGRTMAKERAVEHVHHVQLALLQHRLERHHASARVVEQAVHAHGYRVFPEHDAGQVAHVAMPQVHGSLRLPAHPRLAYPKACARALPLLLVKAAQGRLAQQIFVELPLLGKCRQNQGGGRVRMLGADVEQKRALLRGKRLCKALVRARLGAQGAEATAFGGVKPTLQGGYRIAARDLASRRTHALVAERA